MKILLAFMLLSIPLIGSATTIEGDNFILRDENGRITAQLTKSGEGSPALFFYDAKGTPRISIGLYGDGVPGVVLNDEAGLATAILRMVNNQGDPVLVLKEKGQDKVIIDKNGIKGISPGNSISTIQLLLLSLISGGLGGFVAYILLQKKNTLPETSFGGNIS